MATGHTWLRLVMRSRVFWLGVVCSAVATTIVGLSIGTMMLELDIDPYFLTAPLYFVVLILSCVLGAARVLVTHPVFDAEYRQWLSSTPWTPNHPLPKSPMHLVWADAVVVGVLSLIAFTLQLTFPPANWLTAMGALVAFVAGLAVAGTLANAMTGEMRYVYLALCIPVAIGLLRVSPEWLALGPFAMAAIAWQGVKRSLRTFPWNEPLVSGLAQTEKLRSTNSLGWPYSLLKAQYREFITDRRTALIEALLLAGWVWLLSFYCHLNNEQEKFTALWAMACFVSVFGIGGRLSLYGEAFCEHLCLGYRLAHRRLIVPAHDRVLLAPLFAAIAATLVPPLLFYSVGLSSSLSIAIGAAVAWFVVRNVGPTVRELAFTGFHAKFGRMPANGFITVDGKQAPLANRTQK